MTETGKVGTSEPVARGTRYGFVDLLRGFALVVMIETHVVNAYLPAAYRNSRLFFWLSFINGLVAPTFLFASGFSVMLQSSRQWDNWLHFRLPFWKQMRRLGFITLVAYYSHLQYFKLSRYLHPEDPDLWKNTLQVDILQCIVASLLIIHVLILLLRKPGRAAWGIVILAAATALLTPWIWAHDFTKQLPLALALFVNPHGISLFPLFPWMSFLLFGAAVSHFFLKSVAVGSDARCMRHLFVAGLVMIIGGLLGSLVPFSLPGHQNFFTTSPLYVVIRLGCVLIGCTLLYALEKFLRIMPSPIRLAGQESLLVYGVHLWVIFALLRGKHVGSILGLDAGYPGCLLLSSGVILFMLWLAGQWHDLKQNYPKFTKRAQAITVVIMIVVFILR